MSVPNDRQYSDTHEWFLLQDDIVTMGITEFAAEELTDITFVELPAVGATFEVGAKIGEVESVKATSEIFTAVGGSILEANQQLADHPELINDSAFDDGWLVKIKPEHPYLPDSLMDATEYEAHISGKG